MRSGRKRAALRTARRRVKPHVREVCTAPARSVTEQPAVNVQLHSAGDASPLTALLLPHIFPICSVVAPCQHSTGSFPIHQVRNYLVSEVVSWERGASPPSVRRWTFTTGCWAFF